MQEVFQKVLLLGYAYGIIKEVQARRDYIMNELGTYIKGKKNGKRAVNKAACRTCRYSHTEVKRIEDGL